MTMEITKMLQKHLEPMAKEHRKKLDGATKALPSSSGSVLYAVRVISFRGHTCFADDDIVEDVKKIGKREFEMKQKGHGNQDAHDNSRVEWLSDFLSQNTEVRRGA